MPRSRAAGVLIRLESLGLVSTLEHGMALTRDGREEALRMVRIHRLWERYLAERTGVSRSRWHEEAERREHHLSAEETERLSREMGHPAYDPHGDPIPTAEGEVPPPQTVALPALQEGELARIEHVEDEPEEVYRQLTEAGLHPGTRVQLVSAGDEEIRLIADGRLPQPAAGGGRQRLRPCRSTGRCRGHTTASTTSPGGSGRESSRISPACRGLERRRLLDLGLLPGTEVLRRDGEPHRRPGGLPGARGDGRPAAPAGRADPGRARAAGDVRVSRTPK